MSDKIEIAQLPTLETVRGTTRVLVQDGVAGTAYRQTTASGLIAGLVDEIGVGTIVAGSVVITSGTADLDVLSATTADVVALTGTIATVDTIVAGGAVITSGTADLDILSATTANLVNLSGTIATVSTIAAVTTTSTLINAGTVAVSGVVSAGTVSATISAPQTITVGGETITDPDPRWGLVTNLQVDKNGAPTGYIDTATGVTYHGQMNAVSLISDAATVGTVTADAAVSTVATSETIVVGDGTSYAGDARWGLFSGLSLDAKGAPISNVANDGTNVIGAAIIHTLELGNEPTSSGHAATKGYVDSVSGGTSGAYSAIELESRDAACLAQSMAIRDQVNTTLAGMPWKYSHIIHYGQSFALGFGATLITKTAGPDGTWSFGTRPANTVATNVFTQSGASAFADLTISAGNEVPAIGMANHLRRSQLRSLQLTADTTRQIVVNAAGKGGTALEDLSKGASPTEYYAQITDLISKSVTAAGSDSYGVAAICLEQGETNYSDGAAENTEAGYQALVETFASDVAADVISGTGQTYGPGIFLCQTSSVWDTAAGDVSAIGNAQLAASLANTNIYLVGPYYAYPDDGTNHLTGDGYRWLGEQFGKVCAKVLLNGEGWAPCHIVAAYFRANKVLLEIHTPEPPLQVQQAYAEETLTSYTNHGFIVGDDGGSVSISSVEVNRSSIVLNMARDLIAADNPWVQYAGNASFDGGGNICDSDPTLSYHTSTLTSARYPLYNWLCGQRLDLVEDV